MLKISEHFEFFNHNHLKSLEKVEKWQSYFNSSVFKDVIYFCGDKEKICAEITLEGKIEDKSNACFIHSSYYIGLDSFPHIGLNIHVEPKLNTESLKVDYVKILLEALTEPENFEHLDGLIETKFDHKWVEINSKDQPMLTPFLLAQYLSIVKDLIRKGLRKAYYNKQENLNNRVKGKILVGEQIRNNILKSRPTYTLCQFQNYGVDIEVNRFLKHVLRHVKHHLEKYSKKSQLYINLCQILNYCIGAFKQVSEESFTKMTYKENNPFYKNYEQAITIGNQILKLTNYNISNSINPEKVKHPPFWLDMSKLFELYVFMKLKQQFPNDGEVKYHQKFNRQEPDFILNTRSGIKAIVDAKYKPRYRNGNPSMVDARQLSGYARLNKIYEELNIEEHKIIPVYFIYPSELVSDKNIYDSDKLDWNSENGIKILDSSIRSSTTYTKMYMQDIQLWSI